MNSALVKILYLLVLIGFVFGIFQQGKDGGELVYEYGMNVAKVKTLDDKIFELEEEIEEADEALEKAEEKIAKSVKKVKETVISSPAVISQPVPEVIKEKTPEETTLVETISNTVQAPKEVVEAVKTEIKAESLPYTEPVHVEQMPEAVQQVQIPTH